MKKNRAIFLDRDGTIIHHVPYLANPEGLKLFPDTIDSLKAIRNAGFLAILVTNQSGIKRGYLTEDILRIIHEKLNFLLSGGGTTLDAIYYCHHLPGDNCLCRKPKSGMLIAASEKYNIDLKSSYIIGDDPKDVEAGQSAGCKTVLLAKESELALLVTPTFQTDRLFEATRWVIQDAKKSLQESGEKESLGRVDIR